MNPQILKKEIKKLVTLALKEDIGKGDVTTMSTISKSKTAKARIFAKEDMIVCGVDVAKEAFLQKSPDLKIKISKKDGELVKKNGTIMTVTGTLRSILLSERVALNFMQRLSGIATLTNKYVKEVKGTNTKILDTRKTTPSLRLLEKYAVTKGGGINHRFGLFDMVMIKDNHIEGAGSITRAVELARKNKTIKAEKLKIEVETKNLKEVKEALLAKADNIMLDNMTIKEMKEAVIIINKKARVEASGNVTLKRVRDIAKTNVDFISVGSLTHSAPAMDISLLVEK